MRIGSLLPVLTIVALASIAPAPAQAATSTEVRACVKKKGGQLRVVTKPRCKRSERSVTLRLAGATGAQGAQGEVGPAGPAGPAGPQGAVGEAGATGATGPQGATGATGEAGPQGATGPQGDAGTDGTDGADGTNGADGADGTDGADGADGIGGLSDYLRVTGTASSSNETSPKTVTADCSGGRKALGGGYVVTVASGAEEEIATYSNYASDDDSWSVTSGEDQDGRVGSWSIQAYVICASAS